MCVFVCVGACVHACMRACLSYIVTWFPRFLSNTAIRLGVWLECLCAKDSNACDLRFLSYKGIYLRGINQINFRTLWNFRVNCLMPIRYSHKQKNSRLKIYSYTLSIFCEIILMLADTLINAVKKRD